MEEQVFRASRVYEAESLDSQLFDCAFSHLLPSEKLDICMSDLSLPNGS